MTWASQPGGGAKFAIVADASGLAGFEHGALAWLAGAGAGASAKDYSRANAKA